MMDKMIAMTERDYDIGHDGDGDGHDGADDEDGDLDVLPLLVLPSDDTVAVPTSCLVRSGLGRKAG